VCVYILVLPFDGVIKVSRSRFFSVLLSGRVFGPGAGVMRRAWRSGLALRGRLVPAVTVACLLWTAGGTLLNHPHHLAYFNELAGGPENGWKHLLGSSFDWGQDVLFAVRRSVHGSRVADTQASLAHVWLRGAYALSGLGFELRQITDWSCERLPNKAVRVLFPRRVLSHQESVLERMQELSRGSIRVREVDRFVLTPTLGEVVLSVCPQDQSGI